jgi:hypothetical protein
VSTDDDRPLRYNAVCPIDGCLTWMREDDVVCKRHYVMLPPEYRRLLRRDRAVVLNWIDEQERET